MYNVLGKQFLTNPFTKTFKKIARASFSTLVETFNSNSPQNKVLGRESTGLFNVSELNTSFGFLKLQTQCVSKIQELIEEALDSSRKRKMVEIFDDMSDSLCRVADLAEFIRLAHPEPQYRQAAEKACLTISEIVEELNTNIRLYDNLKQSVTKGDVEKTTEVDDLVGELFLFDFEQNGIHLPENLRNKVVSLNNSILNFGQQFVAGSDSPRIIKKSEVPPLCQNSFISDGEDIIVSGLYVDSMNPMIREMAYKIYYYPDKHQEFLLENLTAARYNLARICGFNSYAERALRGGTLDETTDVMKFLDRTSDNIKEFSNLEFQLMKTMKEAENIACKEVNVWDVPHYIMKVKKDWFRVSQEEFSSYFSLGACMEGLNTIFKNLFGITLVNCQIANGECWSRDVYKLAVKHENEGILGYIYCDFFERPGKQNQDCHFTIQGGRELKDGSYQIPIAVLMLNFRPPTWGMPSLLTPHNVDNLFHEMGHAMHSMLARTKYQHVTGTRCSTDFAEVPSVLMEYFASDPRIIRLFAKHYETNEPIPEEMLQRLCASKKVFMACETKMQIFYSALDQFFHGENPDFENSKRIIADLHERYYGLKQVPNTAWHLRFSHLFGYGAKYYSYLVSRAIAYSIWQNYFKKDPLDRNNGESYRRECLAHGGGRNPKKLVTDFLKIKVSPEALADSLITEIEQNHNTLMTYSKMYNNK
ncbi:mitochondrial intermediate peptidase [Coccinella septempunctata]|uniref:mitochondrial intermediate peptidase n=1 Tax=Coccinella septempunctata TaxID=41139 RepID=UPI001D062BB4|nr:mitochondrial intermediate peptidase [Coccinella septempunctata]